MTEALNQLTAWLGLGADSLTWYQMALRALVMYLAALVMVRVGEKRFLGKNTAFDVILGIILGSVVSRAINGSAGFFETIVAGFVLVGLHWLLAVGSFRSDRFGNLIKGHRRLLVRDGELQWDQMGQSHVTRQDLMEQVRKQTHQEDLDDLDKAYLERSGDVSLVNREKTPRVVEVQVAEGVQTVRIELS